MPNNAFNDLMNYVYNRYAGVLLERQNGGWHVPSLKKWFQTRELAEQAIDKARNDLINLIKKQNPNICTPKKQS